LGCKVKLEDSKGEVHTYQVVGSAEVDPANDKISNESPVGQAILDHKKGDVVNVTTPSGKVLQFTILSISR
jgi:transcription elongation factor GreA